MVSSLGLKPYLHREGLIYRLLPYKRNENIGSNAMHQYNMIMNDFEWGNISDDVYLDWTHVRMFYSFSYRSTFADVAKKLAKEGHKDKAVELLDKCRELIPADIIPDGYTAHEMIEA